MHGLSGGNERERGRECVERAERKTGTNAGSGAFVFFKVYNEMQTHTHAHTLSTHTHTGKESNIHSHTERECVKKRQRRREQKIQICFIPLLWKLFSFSCSPSLSLSVCSSICCRPSSSPSFPFLRYLQKRNDFRKKFLAACA